MSPKRLSIAALALVVFSALGIIAAESGSSGSSLGSLSDKAGVQTVRSLPVKQLEPAASSLEVSQAKLAQVSDVQLPAKPKPVVYKVSSGDTLSKIALKFDIKNWERLYCENKKVIGNDPGVITPGMRLLIGKGKYCLIPAPPHAIVAVTVSQPLSTSPVQNSQPSGQGIYSYSALESLWESAGGPNWAAPQAAQIAECESGGNPRAYNPSGATGIWQILGQVVPGNLYDPFVNALNAVFKFHESGDTFAQWVCQ